MIDKPNVTRIWASAAAAADIVDPDVRDPGKFAAGWEGEIPPYEYFNFLHKLFTQMFAHINERGISEWDASTQYRAGASYVQRNGQVYRALEDTKGIDPASSPAQWAVWPPSAPSGTTATKGLVRIASQQETQEGVISDAAVAPSGLSSRTATTTRTGLTAFATGSETAAGDISNKAITPSSLSSRTATTARRGLIQLATEAETTAGSNQEKAVTPSSFLRSLNTILSSRLESYLLKTDPAASAHKLQTARTINGVAFDGTRNITVTADSTPASVFAANTAMQHGGVGAFAYLAVPVMSSASPGQLWPGGSLWYSGSSASEQNSGGKRASTSYITSPRPTGTWRCLGGIAGEGGYGATLFVRVS